MCAAGLAVVASRRARVVAVLQRQLCDLLRQARAGQVRDLLHQAISTTPYFPRCHYPPQVLQLRERIAALDATAALYPSWGGPMPEVERNRRDA